MLEVVVFGIDPGSVLALARWYRSGSPCWASRLPPPYRSGRDGRTRHCSASTHLWAVWMMVLSFAVVWSGCPPTPALVDEVTIRTRSPGSGTSSGLVGPATQSISPIEGAAYSGNLILLAMVILVLTALCLRAVALREPRRRREPAPGARPSVFERLRGVARRWFVLAARPVTRRQSVTVARVVVCPTIAMARVRTGLCIPWA